MGSLGLCTNYVVFLGTFFWSLGLGITWPTLSWRQVFNFPFLFPLQYQQAIESLFQVRLYGCHWTGLQLHHGRRRDGHEQSRCLGPLQLRLSKRRHPGRHASWHVCKVSRIYFYADCRYISMNYNDKFLGALKFQSCTVEGCSRCRNIEYEHGKSGRILNSRLARRTTPPPSLPTGSQFPSTSTGRSTHSRCLSLIISFISLDQTIVIHFKLCLYFSVDRCTRTTLQSLMPSWGTPIVTSFRMKKPGGRVVIDLFGIYLHYII